VGWGRFIATIHIASLKSLWLKLIVKFQRERFDLYVAVLFIRVLVLVSKFKNILFDYSGVATLGMKSRSKG